MDVAGFSRAYFDQGNRRKEVGDGWHHPNEFWANGIEEG